MPIRAPGKCRNCGHPAGERRYCPPCGAKNRERNRAYYALNGERVKIRIRGQRYGITIEVVQKIISRGACEICGSADRLHIDHDHVSQAVRGLLCHSCNNMLGRAKDRPEVLRRAAEYLEVRRS